MKKQSFWADVHKIHSVFTVSGKNLHDDAPDACAMLVDFITGGIKVVTVAKRPFYQ